MSGPGDTGGRQKPPDYSTMAMAGTAVTEIAAPVLIGVWLDSRYGWSPWGVVVGAVLGFVGGIFHLMWIANRTTAGKRQGGDDENGGQSGGGPPGGG